MSGLADRFEHLYGADVFDRDGERVGTARALYADNNTGQLTFVGVGVGLFDIQRRLVPLAFATLGFTRIDLPYAKKLIMKSPKAGELPQLTASMERAVCRYYGLSSPIPWLG